MTEAASFCAYCGTRIEPGSRYCSNCGRSTSLAGAPVAGSGRGSDDKVRKKTNKIKILGIVIITLLVFFGALYALLNFVESRDDGTNLARSNNTSTTPQQPLADPLSDPQALIREVGAYMHQQGWKYPQQPGETNMTRVAAGIVVSKYAENQAVVIIIPTETWGCWSGSIMGSDYVSATYDGCNTGVVPIPCGFFGSYSLFMQRTGESNGSEFLVQVWKGGELLKQAGTSADYGVVSFAGGCSGG